MDEYINRDDLLKAAWEKPTLSLSVYDIGNIKPADVAPVRHARWKRSGALLECQLCGEIYSQLSGNAGKSWNYCPNCGAKMDGGTD